MIEIDETGTQVGTKLWFCGWASVGSGFTDAWAAPLKAVLMGKVRGALGEEAVLGAEDR